MTKRQQRMAAVAVLVLGLGVAAFFGFTAFRKNMMYFYTPSDLATQTVAADTRLRLGGLVTVGSVKRGDGLRIDFTLADCSNTLPVRYDGILPDLFREGQGIVAMGRMQNGVFVADEVLAKHDENYMPPELADSLKGKDGKHSCAPFKSMTGESQASRPPPLSRAAGEGGTIGRADGGVRAAPVAADTALTTNPSPASGSGEQGL